MANVELKILSWVRTSLYVVRPHIKTFICSFNCSLCKWWYANHCPWSGNPEWYHSPYWISAPFDNTLIKQRDDNTMEWMNNGVGFRTYFNWSTMEWLNNGVGFHTDFNWSTQVERDAFRLTEIHIPYWLSWWCEKMKGRWKYVVSQLIYTREQLWLHQKHRY